MRKKGCSGIKCQHSSKGRSLGFHSAGLLFCVWTGTPAPFLYAALLPACFEIESHFRHCLVLTVTESFFSLLGGGADRGAVPGKGQMLGNDQAFVNGWIEEQLLIKAENEKKRMRTATGAGSPTGIAISSVIISICLWLPIPTAISPCFLF